jgi:site-specific DNA recombinase
VGTTATGRSRTYRYYTCHTRNRYGTTCCDAPRIDADALDDRVLTAMSEFYQTRTTLITEAITAAHETYRAARRAAESELRAIGVRIAQKETAADRYFTDYENGTIDQGILERRIEQIGRELHDLRRHRDRLHLRLDTEPVHLTDLDPAMVSEQVADVIAHGAAAVRRSLYEATIHQLRLDLDNAAATPVFRELSHLPQTHDYGT